MTPTEVDQVLAEIGKRQTLDMFDQAAIREVIANHSTTDVLNACVRVRVGDPFIDAPKLAAALQQVGDAWAAWQHIVQGIIEPGHMHQHATERRPLPDGMFPSAHAQKAFRAAYQAIREKPAQQAWQAFRAAYQNTTNAGPVRAQLEEARP